MKSIDYFLIGGLTMGLIFILILLVLSSDVPRILPTPRAFGPML